MPGCHAKLSRVRLAIGTAGACLCLAMAVPVASGRPAAHAGERVGAQTGGRRGGRPALPGPVNRWFRATAAPERLEVPAALVGGKQTVRAYTSYVLVEVAAEGQIGDPPRPLDPFYGAIDPGYLLGFPTSVSLRLNMGFAGSSARERGGETIDRWIVYLPGEGWRDPVATDHTAPHPQASPDHRYTFVIFLGQAARRLALGSGASARVGPTAVGDGRYALSLTPLALLPGIRVPARSRSWVPITPNLLTLREKRFLTPTTTDLGKRSQDMPALPCLKAVGTSAQPDYEIRFPGTDMLPVPGRASWGASRNHLRLPSGNVVRLIRAGEPPAVAISGRTDPLTFGHLLTAPGAWPTEMAEQIRNALKREYYGEDAYEFFGLARFREKAYVGVVWYSPGYSQHFRGVGLLLKLGPDGDPVPVRAVAPERDIYGDSLGPPLMDALPDGRMVLVQRSRMWVLNPEGKWREFRMTLPEGPDVWLRGRWLVCMTRRGYRASVGYPVDIQRTDVRVDVQDVLSRRILRQFRWGTLEYRGNSLYDTPGN